MTWFRVDDGFWRSRKVRLLGAEHRVAAVGCWTLSGDWSADNLTDGFVPAEVVADWDPSGVLTERLITVGLWSKDTYDGETGIRYHDWHDWQPSKMDVLETRRYNARKTSLYRDPELLEQVRRRDRERCRYCGTKVNWRDRRSPSGGLYDHVEHDGVNTADNLVVCCRHCSSEKAGRPASVAGMALLPEGSTGLKKARAARPGPITDPVPSEYLDTEPVPYLDTNQIRSSKKPDPDPSRPDPSRPTKRTPPGGSATAPPSAQTLVAEWIDRCAKRPPTRTIGQMAKTIGQLVDDGVDPNDIRRGLADWMTKDLSPGLLPSCVDRAMNRRAPLPSANGHGPTRVPTTTQRVAAIEALRTPPEER